MSNSLNKVSLIGRVGKDPEGKYMQNGSQMAYFSLATSTSWKDKATGEKQENTEWHNIVSFGKLSEIITQYVKRGNLLYVDGRLKYNKYTDKNGVEKTSCQIVADTVNILVGTPRGEAENQKEATAKSDDDYFTDDDDIPF